MRHVLCVDDDDIARMIAHRRLSVIEADISVTEADSVESAVAALELAASSASFPELIVLDLVLGLRSGVEVIEALVARYASDHPDTVVVVTSASVREDQRATLLAYRPVRAVLAKSDFDRACRGASSLSELYA